MEIQKLKQRIELPSNVELLEGEVFIEIEGSRGYYFISNLGRCYNKAFDKFMFVNDNGAGYKTYVLSRLKKQSNYIHRLVAQHFIPNPEGKKFVNHIDHNRSNNCASNLEWVTAKENTKHGIDAGRINSKLRGKTNQLTLQDRVKAVILRQLGYGVNEIAVKLGFARTTMSSVFNGRSGSELVDLIFSETEGWSEKRLDLALTHKVK